MAVLDCIEKVNDFAESRGIPRFTGDDKKIIMAEVDAAINKLSPADRSDPEAVYGAVEDVLDKYKNDVIDSQSSHAANTQKQFAPQDLKFIADSPEHLVRLVASVASKKDGPTAGKTIDGIKDALLSNIAPTIEKLITTAKAGKVNPNNIARKLAGESGDNVTPDEEALADELLDQIKFLRNELDIAQYGNIRKSTGDASPAEYLPVNYSDVRMVDMELEGFQELAKKTMLSRTGDELTDDEISVVYDRIVENGSIQGRGTTQRYDWKFRDFESYQEWSKQMGDEDFMHSMFTYFMRMPKKIAVAEILGTDVNAGINAYLDVLPTDVTTNFHVNRNEINLAFQSQIGNLDAVNRTKGFERTITTQVLDPLVDGFTTGMLSNLAISMTQDFGQVVGRAGFFGTPMVRAFKEYYRKYNPVKTVTNRQEVVEEAARMGVMLQRVGAEMREISRLGDTPQDVKGRFAEFVRKWGFKARQLTGSYAMLETVQKQAAEIFSGEMAHNLKRYKYGELPAEVKDSMDRYAINEDDWNKLRAALDNDDTSFKSTYEGVDIRRIDTPKLYRFDRDLGQKYARIIGNEVTLANGEDTALTSALLKGTSQRGTFRGSWVRARTRLLTHPTTTTLNTTFPLMRGAVVDKDGNKMKTLAGMAVAGATLGYISLQLRSIVRDGTIINDEELLEGKNLWKWMIYANQFGFLGELVTAPSWDGGITNIDNTAALGILETARQRILDAGGTVDDFVEFAASDEKLQEALRNTKGLGRASGFWWADAAWRQGVALYLGEHASQR